jgi:hypothetical protein
MDAIGPNTSVPDDARGAAIALGNFDGVHSGHQAVIASVWRSSTQALRRLGNSRRASSPASTSQRAGCGAVTNMDTGPT